MFCRDSYEHKGVKNIVTWNKRVIFFNPLNHARCHMAKQNPIYRRIWSNKKKIKKNGEGNALIKIKHNT